MRRTQSSSTVLPVTKKRKTSHTTAQKDPIPRDISRVASLTPPKEVKRRRTASPAYRLRRSPSDDETDFSEPVRIFRDETPDVSQNPAVERSMLNLHAGEDLRFMHAKELACEVDKDSFLSEDPAKPALEITVQLPFGEETFSPLKGNVDRRFKLLRPKKHDEYHPTGDVVDTVSHLLTYFLPNDTLPPETTTQDYLYKLSKAIKSTEPEHAIPLITPINDKIVSLRPFTPVIEKMPSMPRDLLLRITMQCYTRQVSPHLDGLRKYAAFSSTVYGELLFPFLSQLFSDLTLSPGQTFVDLGCGVGNCLIQAAGETGCAAIGIEIMDHAATLAVAQIAEFEARMRAWGLSHGQITFHHGDILTHPAVPTIMQRANVVLCNNYAFTAELNDALLNLFLDLPEGAKVVSLRSFIPVGKDGRARSARGGVGEMLSVQKARFRPGSVSWMPGGGEYFISTVARTSSAYGTPRSIDS
jgi:H3 lysine-79-specific histone-lysine N-methyltransferase